MKNICLIAAALLPLMACGSTTIDSNAESDARDSAIKADSTTVTVAESSDGSEYINDLSKVDRGIVGEIIFKTPDCDDCGDHEFTLYANHEIYSEPRDGMWERVGDAIVIFTGEGTTYYTILNGYAYNGYYNAETGECFTEEWDETEECLDDVGYIPNPSKGGRVKSFVRYVPELK